MEAHLADMSLGEGGAMERPSFFELVAQDSMMSMLKPALRHLVTVLAARRPFLLEKLLRYHDEMYAAFILVTQLHYLKTYGASMSENFYGLKRVLWLGERRTWRVSLARAFRRVFDGKLINATPVTRLQEMPANAALSRSLFLLVALPYVKVKLDRWHNYLKRRAAQHQQLPTSLGAASGLAAGGGAGSSSGSGDGSDAAGGAAGGGVYVRAAARCWRLVNWFNSVFEALYPFLHFAGEGAFFVYQLAYLFGHTRYYTPFYHLAGLELRRVTAEDLMAQRQTRAKRQMQRALQHRGPGVVRAVRRLLSNLLHTSLEYSKFVLPITIFFFKFLEWWYSSDHSTNAMALPVPPPPQRPPRAHAGLAFQPDPAVCALCAAVRTNPAVLACSGYSFCYPCVHSYVLEHARCPHTHIPTTTERIIKIYSTDR